MTTDELPSPAGEPTAPPRAFRRPLPAEATPEEERAWLYHVLCTLSPNPEVRAEGQAWLEHQATTR